MKKKKLIYIVLIALCLIVFIGYRIVDRGSADTKPPVINIGGELEVTVDSAEDALFASVTAQDNKDGDVTDSLVVESLQVVNSDGTVLVTYAAFDNAGNVSKAERTVRYTDYVSPRFTLSVPLVFSSASFDVLNIVGAEDIFDGDIKHRVRANLIDDADITEVGVHNVQFRVSNSLGDSAELILPVEVLEAGTYNATLTLKEYIVYLPVGADFNAESYLDDFTCYGNTVSLPEEAAGRYRLTTSGSVDTQTPGIYAVSYEVTYNQTYTGYSKLMVIVEG